jgi:hypothetical protein
MLSEVLHQWQQMISLCSHIVCRIWGSHNVVMKSSFLCGRMLCNLLKVSWSFSGTCHFHLQGWRLSHAGNKAEPLIAETLCTQTVLYVLILEILLYPNCMLYVSDCRDSLVPRLCHVIWLKDPMVSKLCAVCFWLQRHSGTQLYCVSDPRHILVPKLLYVSDCKDAVILKTMCCAFLIAER